MNKNEDVVFILKKQSRFSWMRMGPLCKYEVGSMFLFLLGPSSQARR